MIRSYLPKDVMFIYDFPLVKEAESGIPYSEHSSLQLKDALISASSFNNKNQDIKYHLGLNEVCFAYLSTNRPAKGDSDWSKSICKKKNIPEGEEYVCCEWLKDVWISQEVYKQIQDTLHQIRTVKPKLLICAGKWAFMFLATLPSNPTAQLATPAATKTTFKKQVFFGALNKYRASTLTTFACHDLHDILLFPILTPSYHWVVKDKAEIIRKDYIKVAYFNRRLRSSESVASILTSPRELILSLDKSTVLHYLTTLLDKLNIEPVKVVSDVETKFMGIDCVGFCYEPNKAFTLPMVELYTEEADGTELVTVSRTVKGKKVKEEIQVPAGTILTKHRHYWSIDDEVEIMHLVQQVMLHPNCKHVGQNFLYDSQMYFREWRISIQAYADTMIQHHVLYNYMQKDLQLLASLYCVDFIAWKEEIDGQGQGV